MNAVDIAVIVIVSVAVVAVAGWLIYSKIKGKGGCCGCGCKEIGRASCRERV